MSEGSLDRDAFDFFGIHGNKRKIAVSENQYIKNHATDK